MAVRNVRERIIWGKWDCSECDTKGISAEPPPGETIPRCPQCGAPRDMTGRNQTEAAYLDNERAASGRVLGANVADTPDEIRIASAGPDWHCTSCNADNRAGESSCVSCGSPREVRPSRSETPPTPPRRETGRPNRETRSNSNPWQDPPKQPKPNPALTGAVILACSLGLLALFYAMFHTVPQQGVVASASWVHRIQTYTWEAIEREDWRNDLRPHASVPPRDGRGEVAGVEDIRGCVSRTHHQERYSCGSHEECHLEQDRVKTGESCHEVCSTHDQGNGSFKETCHDSCSPTYKQVDRKVCKQVTDYCQRPIYQDWCTYTTYRWSPGAVYQESGTGFSTKWPAVNLSPLQKGERRGVYTVQVKYGQKQTTVSPSSEVEYRKWPVGKQALVHVNAFGGVMSVEPPLGFVVAP